MSAIFQILFLAGSVADAFHRLVDRVLTLICRLLDAVAWRILEGGSRDEPSDRPSPPVARTREG